MAWEIQPGAGLLVPSGTYHDPTKRHLFVICRVSPTHVLMVSIATWLNDMCDDSCILEKAEYSFIKHKSYIHYRKARIESIKAIHGGIEKGVLIPHHIFEEDCFKRVCEGFMKSNQLPWKLKQAWKKWK